MKTLIQFNTAKLAKEKGFQLMTKDGYYNDTGEFWEDWDLYCSDRYVNRLSSQNVSPAPSQQVLANWLLEKHGYFVSVELAYNKWGKYAAKIEKLSKDGKTAILALDGLTIFDNPYNAWEEGLHETLQLSY